MHRQVLFNSDCNSLLWRKLQMLYTTYYFLLVVTKCNCHDSRQKNIQTPPKDTTPAIPHHKKKNIQSKNHYDHPIAYINRLKMKDPSIPWRNGIIWSNTITSNTVEVPRIYLQRRRRQSQVEYHFICDKSIQQYINNAMKKDEIKINSIEYRCRSTYSISIGKNIAYDGVLDHEKNFFSIILYHNCNVSFNVLLVIYNRWLQMKEEEVNCQDAFIRSNNITFNTVEVPRI